MPRIPPKFLNGAVYLYKTREDAEVGSNKGGTGFIVSLPSVTPDREFLFFVTNWHVAVQKGFPVVRVDKFDGTIDIFEFDCADWHFSPKYDIAAIPAHIDKKHKVSIVPQQGFLTKENTKEQKIGPGDDVFMVGRFVNHQGSNQNTPAARFGHISMDPAPIVQPNGENADTYCVDMHSRSGYSGSPVFVYRTPGYDLEELKAPGLKPKILYSGTSLLALLGIHWGQFPEIWEVTNDGKLKDENSTESSEPLITGGRFIKGLSGMTCVLPAWSILEVLDMPKLKKDRDAENAKLAETSGDIPVAEGSFSEEAEDGVEEGDKILRKMLDTPPKPRQ